MSWPHQAEGSTEGPERRGLPYGIDRSRQHWFQLSSRSRESAMLLTGSSSHHWWRTGEGPGYLTTATRASHGNPKRKGPPRSLVAVTGAREAANGS